MKSRKLHELWEKKIIKKKGNEWILGEKIIIPQSLFPTKKEPLEYFKKREFYALLSALRFVLKEPNNETSCDWEYFHDPKIFHRLKIKAQLLGWQIEE